MMVVCTLVINASTLKPLLSVLRFVELSHEELTMLAHVAERLKKDARKEMKRIQDDPFLSNSNWEIVRQYADLDVLFRPLLKGARTRKSQKGDARDGGSDRIGDPESSDGVEASGQGHRGSQKGGGAIGSAIASLRGQEDNGR